MAKLGGQPVFSPADFRRYLAGRRGVPEAALSVPEDIVFTYQTGIFRTAIERTKASLVDWYIYHDRLYHGTVGDRQVGVVHAMIGASAASMNLEEMIAYGAKRVYEVGRSGAVDKNLRPGKVVVLDGALSDEGTSKHYFKASPRFASSPALTRKLCASLKEMNLDYVDGDAWTVDSPYRETIEKIATFRRKGALVVNMESSAIFAVAKHRGIDATSVQVISDLLSEGRWEPAFHEDVVDSNGLKVLDGVLHAIKSAD